MVLVVLSVDPPNLIRKSIYCTHHTVDCVGENRPFQSVAGSAIVPLRQTLAKTFRHDRRTDGHRSRSVRIAFRRSVGDRRAGGLRDRRSVRGPAAIGPTPGQRNMLPDRRVVRCQSSRTVRGGVFGHHSGKRVSTKRPGVYLYFYYI